MVNTAPVLDGLSTTVIFAENTVNSGPQLIDTDVTFSDAENNLFPGNLTISGGLSGDVIGVRHQGFAAGEIGVISNTITYSGQAVATFSGGTNGTPLVFAFLVNAGSVAVDALIQNLTYFNASDTPVENRTLVFTILDSNGLSNNAVLSGSAVNFNTSFTYNSVTFDVGSDSAPAFGDFDGDGDMDMISGTFLGGLRYFENRGDGSIAKFQERTGLDNPLASANLTLSSLSVSSSAPTVVDFDKDGKLDILLGSHEGHLQLILNTGTATTPAFQSTATFNAFTVDYGAPALADLDGNGTAELYIGKSDGTIMGLTYSGTLQTSVNFVLFAQTFAGVDVSSLDSIIGARPTFGDIDNDGDLDLLVGTPLGAVRFYKNTGTATAATFVEQTGSANPFNGISYGSDASPAFVDLDHDGDKDVVIGRSDGTFSSWVNKTIDSVVVRVIGENDAPIITSAAAVSLKENLTDVLTVAISDDSAFATPSFSITGGADKALFNIDPATGKLSFIAAPDFETPKDIGGDNTYEVTVTVNDGDFQDPLTATKTFVVTVTDQVTVINGTAGADLITPSTAPLGQPFVSNDPEGNRINAGDGANTIVGGDYKDWIVSGTGADTVAGGGGDDEINSGNGSDTVNGGDGKDRITGGDGVDIIHGGDGNDVITDGSADGSAAYVYGDAGADRLINTWVEVAGVWDGGTGNDTIDFSQEGYADNYLIDLSAPSFALWGNTFLNFENVIGHQYAETVIGSNGNNTMDGQAGDDSLSGGLGADILSGGKGNDRLAGGSDIDTVTGGGGRDTFVLDNQSTSRDFVADFTKGADKLEVSASLFGGGLVASPRLKAGQFLSNTTGDAAERGDRFIYDTSTGVLYYDPDGTGAAAHVSIALFSAPIPLLDNTDIVIV